MDTIILGWTIIRIILVISKTIMDSTITNSVSMIRTASTTSQIIIIRKRTHTTVTNNPIIQVLPSIVSNHIRMATRRTEAHMELVVVIILNRDMAEAIHRVTVAVAMDLSRIIQDRIITAVIIT